MGLGNSENDVIVDDGGGGGGGLNGKSFGVSVSCSICLEVVADNGDRSWAKLQCGHQFHLDCIGSAFNVKGAMQCPNCRKIEKGQWLYANGCRSLPEFSMEDWAHDEDLYDLSYSEMSFGVHWCPFGSLTRLPSSFENGNLGMVGRHHLPAMHSIWAMGVTFQSSSACLQFGSALLGTCGGDHKYFFKKIINNTSHLRCLYFDTININTLLSVLLKLHMLIVLYFFLKHHCSDYSLMNLFDWNYINS
ncbi:E3 ubiquitin-protein ligase [Salix suchowensis]|nr:E3 ubiquitin-protein ligase [Salix suchowensis]